MKVDFIVVGCSRSGTTWVHDNIISHPEIFLPPTVNEPHFFTKNYDQGIDYYHALFEGYQENKKAGEVTPDYIYSKEAAMRMKEYNPNLKLIVIVRHPVDRLYSLYWILRGKYKEENDHSFEEKLEKDPWIIEQGYYIDHIKNYLEYFERDQLLVLLFDELKSDPDNFLKKLFTFIGVGDSYKAPHANTKINRGTFRKHYSKSKVLFFVWRVLKKLKWNKAAYQIEKINSKKTEEMTAETRQKLIELYRPYNEKLEEFLGVDLSDWNK